MAQSRVRNLYSYKSELGTFDWDGKGALIVFDGVCVLCCFFAQWVLRHDKSEKFLFTTAQSPLGQSLYKHYQLDPSEFETNLVIIDGQLYEKMDGLLSVCRVIGYPWRVFSVFRYLPGCVLDWIYERIASNRYGVFGKRDSCLVPTGAIKDRMVGS